MNLFHLIIFALGLSTLLYFVSARKFTHADIGGAVRSRSTRPSTSAWYIVLCSLIPALVFVLALAVIEPDTRLEIFNDFMLILLTASIALAGSIWGLRRIGRGLNIHKDIEKLVRSLLWACAALAILVTIGIVLSVLFETIRFFQLYPLQDFLFGLQWSPQTAIREDQVGGSGSFGFIPVFAGTLMISLIAIALAAPLGFLSAIYLAEFSNSKVRKLAKPALEILAGIPTVVYGFFAALWVAPGIRTTAEALGLQASSESALAAGLVMGIMLIPFVCSLSDDVINAVPHNLRNSSYALGATRAETIRRVIMPAATPGIVGSLLLAISRAIGETMIVLMAAGLAAKLSANPLDAMTTVTVQITSLLVGDQEFDSAKTLAAFALGATLFIATLALNVSALYFARRYRETYE